eukprot:gene12837-3581_t
MTIRCDGCIFSCLNSCLQCDLITVKEYLSLSVYFPANGVLLIPRMTADQDKANQKTKDLLKAAILMKATSFSEDSYSFPKHEAMSISFRDDSEEMDSDQKSTEQVKLEESNYRPREYGDILLMNMRKASVTNRDGLWFSANSESVTGVPYWCSQLEEQRYRKKKELNRLAAQRSRERRRQLIKQLEQEVKELESCNDSMTTEIASMRSEIKQLDFMLQSHSCKMTQ